MQVHFDLEKCKQIICMLTVYPHNHLVQARGILIASDVGF